MFEFIDGGGCGSRLRVSYQQSSPVGGAWTALVIGEEEAEYVLID